MEERAGERRRVLSYAKGVLQSALESEVAIQPWPLKP